MLLSARKSFFGEFVETGEDFSESIRKLSLAYNLAFQDILARYRGSVLGPWWITIMTGVLVLGIGVNYAVIFHQPVEGYLPFVAVGLTFWSFLSSTISEGGEAFVAGGLMLRQSALPLPLFVLRSLIRNFINLAHQVVVVIAVLAWFRIFPGPGIAWALVGLVVTVLNLSWIGLLLAMVSARFRDVPQIISAMLQVAFFLSPIFWQPPPKLAGSPLVNFNPFYFLIQSVRDPLLHGTLPVQTVTFLVPLAVIGWAVTLLIYTQTRRRVVHYL